MLENRVRHNNFKSVTRAFLSLNRTSPYSNSVDDFLTEAGWIVWAQRLEETKILNLELTAVKGVTDAVLEHFEQVESSVLLRVSRIYSLTNAGINAFRIIEGSSKKIEVVGCSGLSRTDDLLFQVGLL
ncbi:hypothetical protein BDB00DRAFT_874247 [Zychaea mexicana]|uniref:uncharacterized protein n=1 Tax=Zychaea mexicana TaxID=64656 RepID=UPI0022FEE968|nr:uncharacterized protein BDB00DRAFT_874247 [Zychaea mexicana]KAI9491516.1 hypothetical protein BDB00DRAFT_874247 [Zychaea mexicana]